MNNIEDRRRDFLRLLTIEQEYCDHGHQPAIWKAYADERGMDLEERLWLCFLAMGYSHEGSTWCAINSSGVWRKERLPPSDLKIAILRRNLYGGRLLGHFLHLFAIKSFSKWLAPAIKEGWTGLLRELRTIEGNGSWAAYTTAETIITVCGLPIEADQSGFADNTGPQATLRHLGYAPTDAGAGELVAWVRAEGLDVPVFLLETVMCYWQNMNKGKFYPGRSIDRQQNQIEYARDRGFDVNPLWRARRAVFKLETLGEIQGWPGLDKERLKHYNRTKEILLPTERRTRCPISAQ